MGKHIVIRYAADAVALAQRIGRALGDAGHTVRWQPDTAALPAPDGRHLLLLLWTAAPARRAELLRWAARVPRLLEVTVGPAAREHRLLARRPVELQDAAADLRALLDAVLREGATDDPAGMPAPSAPLPDFSDLLSGTFGGSRSVGDRPSDPLDLPGLFGGGAASASDPLAPAAALGSATSTGGSAAAPQASEPAPVLLAASAPRQCSAGSAFTACLVAYVAAARESAMRRLEQLGEAGDRVVSDWNPDGDAHWTTGAPVTVRVAGAHLTATPAERRFEWNGRENAAAFAISVDAAAPAGSVELCFAVDVAGVPMAFIPMRIVIAATAVATAAPPPTELAVPRSVFVSYASKDAAAVTQRLSTLARWSPGLDIFQDCLDLAPNEDFKPQLAAQIGARDRFLLFWSRHAAASPWVRWEYETARDGKGLAAILPMPLEDPAIAPPPAEFAGTHWRDRFMLAGYALAAIREAAAARP